MGTPRLLALLMVVSVSPVTAQVRQPISASSVQMKPAAECARLTPPPPGDASISHPSLTRLVLAPDGAPTSMRGKTFDVRVLVNREGRADSVVFAGGAVDPQYRAKWIKSLRGNTYKPATWQGCWVRDWHTTQVKF